MKKTMHLVDILRKIAVRFHDSLNSTFGYPIDLQKKYIACFPEPKDDFQRSYFQYRCQMKFNNFFISFLLNIASLPLIILLFVRKNSELSESQKNSVFFSDGKPKNIIPEILRKKIGKIEAVDEKREMLTKDDKIFIWNLWKRYPISFHFIAKCLLKVRFYSFEIRRNHIKNIIVCNEYSFTSSVLTKYCEERGVKHINVMHGEKLFYMRDSFFRFHECYVWDDYYKNLFFQLRAEPTQFRIAVPPSLIFPKGELLDVKSVCYTYYLGGEHGTRLISIINVIKRIKQNGLKVAIRPHPRFTNMEELCSLAGNIEVENCKIMTIEQSLRRTENAISLYSTVLNQAYNNAIGVVIDDVSDKEKYNLLRERAYIMLNKPHKLLSQLLEMNV